jgi:hypothetical protein
MKWRKLGLVFCPSGQEQWMQTHAAVPIPLSLGDDLYRVYFGTRDNQNRPRIGYIEFDINRPYKVTSISRKIVLGPGPRGYFDDNGVYPGCLLKHNDELWMYYLGRSNGTPPLYYMAIGLATSRNNGKTFQKVYKSPLLGRSEYDPWMVSTPFVLREQSIWKMWYLSGIKWDDVGQKSYYHIKYADSVDGIHWKREGHVCIDLRKQETNIASPTVLKEEGVYKMWYSYVAAGQGYRIGYAESLDGYHWTRKDKESGINVSTNGWDSQGLAYPWVFVHHGRKYLLYSGNNFGQDGFGLAVED